MVAFPCKIGAPMTGITLSTRVGRLSGTHFDTGFPLKLNFSAGKEGEGTERCMSQQNCTVEQCFDRCAVASLCTSQLCEKVGKFVGGIMNYHGNKKRIGTACSTVVCRYVGQRPGRYPQDTAESFVKWSSAGLLHSPAYIRWLSKVVEKHGKSGGGRPFVQGWTHTHPTQKPHPNRNNKYATNSTPPRATRFQCTQTSESPDNNR